METMRKEIIKHIKIYCLFIKNSMIAQLEFRFNIVTCMLVEIGYMLAKLLYVMVVHDTGVKINGLSPDSILLFVGTYMLMTVFFVSMMQFNIVQFHNHIREGTFDLLMTKPISLQFIATLRHVDTWTSVPNLIGSLIMIGIGWYTLDIPLTLINLGGFIGFMIGGILMMYSIFVLPLILAFRFINISAIHQIVWALWDFNNMPHRIHIKAVQRVGVFVLPIFLITNFSPLFVMNDLSSTELLWGIFAPILFFLLTRFFWSRSIKYYESASC